MTSPAASPSRTGHDSAVISAGAALDLSADIVDLTAALVDIPSVSRDEERIADLVEDALRAVPHLTVIRIGHTVVARTELGRPERVVIAGHLDTVPPAGNVGARIADGALAGIGACDMKGGVAIGLKLAAELAEPNRDVTYLFYECEEIEAEANGLTKLAASAPELMAADFAVLCEPTDGVVEGGCQGSLHVEVITRGKRSHSARSWWGHNAIHDQAEVLRRLSVYVPREPVVEGLAFHEGLNATGISGGVAGNVIPDECRVGVNYRFAPDQTEAEAFAHLEEVFEGYELELHDSAPAARPGLDRPAAAAFASAIGGTPRAKFGWTDVARFAVLGIPAVNYGPGDPGLAHSAGEFVTLDALHECLAALRRWLE
jgi:succinyl-diaminopimelate desuccinylase